MKWTPELIAQAKSNIATLPVATQGPLSAALDELLAAAPKIGVQGFTLIANYLALGKVKEAQTYWLLTASNVAERIAQSDLDHNAVAKHVQDMADEWGLVRDLAIKLLTAGGQAAIPLLLSLI